MPTAALHQATRWHCATLPLFEAVETDRVLAIDVHEPAAFENAFRLPTRHLEAGLAFAQYFVTRFGPHREKFAVVAPDPGGLKRAQRFRG
ncbi:MAG: hypothetical protein ACJ8AH_18860, partial [Stellaceae bacterium]